MPSHWSRHLISGSLALAFPVPPDAIPSRLFLIAHHDGLQPTQHEMVGASPAGRQRVSYFFISQTASRSITLLPPRNLPRSRHTPVPQSRLAEPKFPRHIGDRTGGLDDHPGCSSRDSGVYVFVFPWHLIRPFG